MADVYLTYTIVNEWFKGTIIVRRNKETRDPYIYNIPSTMYILATKNEQNHLTVVGTKLHPQGKGIHPGAIQTYINYTYLYYIYISRYFWRWYSYIGNIKNRLSDTPYPIMDSETCHIHLSTFNMTILGVFSNLWIWKLPASKFSSISSKVSPKTLPHLGIPQKQALKPMETQDMLPGRQENTWKPPNNSRKWRFVGILLVASITGGATQKTMKL